MAFTTGRQMSTNSIELVLEGSYSRIGTINVYESKLSTEQQQIIFVTDFVKPNRRVRPILPTSTGLDTHVNSYTGIVPMLKYKVYCNSVYDLKIIDAHLGNMYVGGLEFTLTDLVASTNHDFAYETELHIYDLPLLLTYATGLNYRISQNLVFDIGDYQENRRIEYEVIQTTNQYGKLNVSLDLVGNELHVNCRDTRGRSASEHIMNDMGLADTTLTCSSKIVIHGINDDGTTIVRYANIVSNENYDDSTITYYLPNIPSSVTAVEITVDYIIQMYTFSNTITLKSSMVLTDQQIAQLRHASIADLTSLL